MCGMATDKVQIRVTAEQREELNDMQGATETYADVVDRLLACYENSS